MTDTQTVTHENTPLSGFAALFEAGAEKTDIGSEGEIVSGIIVLLIGLGHLLGTALTRAGMSEGLAMWLALALLGLIVAGIGWGMLARAKNALAHEDIIPRQTVDSLRANKEWAQRKLQHS